MAATSLKGYQIFGAVTSVFLLLGFVLWARAGFQPWYLLAQMPWRPVPRRPQHYFEDLVGVPARFGVPGS